MASVIPPKPGVTRGAIDGMVSHNEKVHMLRKIGDFISGLRKNRAGFSETERQIDTGTAIIEMFDKAEVLDVEIVVTFQVGEARESMIMCGRRDDATSAMYQVVSRVRSYWLGVLKRENMANAERLRPGLAARIWPDEEIGGDFDGSGHD